MNPLLDNLNEQLRNAVKFFWATRDSQAVRAGKHLDGFRELVAEILIASGLQRVYNEPNPELSFRTFVTSLLGRAMAVAQMQSLEPSEPLKIEVGSEPEMIVTEDVSADSS